MFPSDHADMCCTHLSRVFRRLKHAACFMLPKTFYVLDLMMEVTQIRAEDGTFQKCIINK